MSRQIVTRHIFCREELETALQLVHDRYVQAGYMEPQPGGIRIGIHYALPSTRTYVALANGDVAATVSLFFDSQLGLPLDAIYSEELDALRAEGRSIAEAGMLADRRGCLGRGIREQLRLMRPVFWAAVNEGMDDLVVGVNPKHVGFYTRLLCFEALGPLRTYSAVCNAPAVLLRLNLSVLDPCEVPKDNVRDLFFAPVDADELRQEYVMGLEDLIYFFIEKTDVFARLEMDEQQVVEANYPGLDISELVTPIAAEPPVGLAQVG